MKKEYDIVFVVLVYGNIEDVIELLDSIQAAEYSFKVIIVNSYCNEESLKKCRSISEQYNCDFVPVENRGYGAGNNRGIEYATKHYKYNFLIVTNPDIVIKKFSYSFLENHSHDVIGPQIITSTGKNQNPFYVDKKIFPRAEYKFLASKNKIGYGCIIAINKMKKIWFQLLLKIKKQHEKRVFAVHGSFIIFSDYAVKRLGQIFDENIFLFCEEMVLAEEMKKREINAIYTDEIIVYHKEDGSMSFFDGSQYAEEVKSNGYVVKKYYMG